MKKYLFVVAMLALVLVPVFSQASTLSDLQAQIAKLQAQIAALQANLVPNSPLPNITQTLGQGSRGAQVTLLQRYLIGQGLLKIDRPTGYFGSLTRSAVVKWQARNNVSPANGIFGPASRNKLVALTNVPQTNTSSDCTSNCIAPPVTPPTPTLVYHPADLDQDYVITKDEADAHTVAWQRGTVPMSEAIRARYLYCFGGGYTFRQGESLPFVPVSTGQNICLNTYHPADSNYDYVIDDLESQAYTALWQNGSTVTMKQAIWALVLHQANRYEPRAGMVDGFGPVCDDPTNPVCANNLYHPADTDRDWVISPGEGTTYAGYWQNGQNGVTMKQAIWALKLSQADGYQSQPGAIDGFGPVCRYATNPVCAN